MAQSTTAIPADVIRELQQLIANNQPKAIGPATCGKGSAARGRRRASVWRDFRRC